MRTLKFNRRLIGVCLTLLSSVSAAEIYKWVDASGQTHYSERKGDAGHAKALELNVVSPAVPASAGNAAPLSWPEQERQFKQRLAQNPRDKNDGSAVTRRPRSLSGGVSDDTDASRCNLARDVISGAVRHSNQKPTDRYDREVAENDIRAYCR